jgi:hypothetical protein
MVAAHFESGGDAVSIGAMVVAMGESEAVAARFPRNPLCLRRRERPSQWLRVLAPVYTLIFRARNGHWREF